MEVPDPDALISTKAIGAGGRHRTADGVGDEQAVDQASGLLTRVVGDRVDFVGDELDVIAGEVLVEQIIIVGGTGCPVIGVGQIRIGVWRCRNVVGNCQEAGIVFIPGRVIGIPVIGNEARRNP